MFDLKRFRSDNNLTQTAVSKLLGCSQNFISLVEKGTRFFADDTLSVLENIYGDLSDYHVHDPPKSSSGNNISAESTIGGMSEFVRMIEARDILVRDVIASRWINDSKRHSNRPTFHSKRHVN